jgi:hypothetical protein
VFERKNRACGVNYTAFTNFLLGSPFKFIYFFSGGVGQFGTFDRSSIVHAVSMTPHSHVHACQ